MPFTKKQWELVILMDSLFWLVLPIYLVPVLHFQIVFGTLFLVSLMFPILKVRVLIDNACLWLICINLMTEQTIYWNFAYCFVVLLFAITNNIEIKSRFLNIYNYVGFFAMTAFSLTRATELKTQVVIMTTMISVTAGLKLINPLILFFKKVVDDQALIAHVYLDIGRRFASTILPKMNLKKIITLEMCCELNDIKIPKGFTPIIGDSFRLIYDLGIINHCIVNAEFALNLDSKCFVISGKTHEIGEILMTAIVAKNQNHYTYDLKNFIN